MFQASWFIVKSQYNTNSIIQTMPNQKDSRVHGSSKRVVHLRALWVTKGFELTSSSLRKYTPWPTQATRSLFHRTRRSVPSQWTFAIFIIKWVNLQDLQKVFKSWVVLLASFSFWISYESLDHRPLDKLPYISWEPLCEQLLTCKK